MDTNREAEKRLDEEEEELNARPSSLNGSEDPSSSTPSSSVWELDSSQVSGTHRLTTDHSTACTRTVSGSKIADLGKSKSGIDVPKVMVSEPGLPTPKIPSVSTLLQDLNLSERFPEVPTAEEQGRQWEQREKWLSRCPFPTQEDNTEDGWENWFDAVALIVMQHGLSPTLMIYLATRVLKPSAGTILAKCMNTNSYEAIVAFYLSRLYPKTAYAKELEVSLHVVGRCASVYAAEEWLQHRLSRYLRVCQRQKRVVLLSPQLLEEAADAAIPFLVTRQLSLSMDVGPEKNWEAYWQRAAILEATLTKFDTKHIHIVGGVSDDEEEEWSLYYPEAVAYPGSTQQRDSTSVPPAPCGLCGGMHWMKFCPHKGSRCEKCHRLGHVERACRATVLKTADGRIDVYILPKPGSIEFRQYRDRTQQDRLLSAQTVLKEILDSSQVRSEKEKDKRIEKKKERDVVGENTRSKKRKNYPATWRGKFKEREEPEEKVAWVEEVACATQVFTTTRWGNAVQIPIIIAGSKSNALLDTGALTCNLVGFKSAQTHGLIATSRKVKIEGVGKNIGIVSEPVLVQIGNHSANLRFLILEDSTLPLLLGLPSLRAFHLRLGFSNTDTVEQQAKGKAKEWTLLPKNVDPEREEEQSRQGTTIICTMQTEKERGVETALQKVAERMDTSLGPQKREEMLSLFRKYSDLWWDIPNGGGRCTGGEAQILTYGRPTKAKARPLTAQLAKECSAQVKELIVEGLIVPSKSPWASAPVFIKKSTGKWRMAIDYRGVNAQTIPDAYPLPRTWDIINFAAGKEYILVMDLKSGFWNIPLSKESRAPTAFLTPLGLYEWCVMPFGLRNAPSEFQRIMDFVLQEVKGQKTYIDDIVHASNVWSGFMQSIEHTLRQLRRFGLFLGIDKLQINCRQAAVLGHIVSKSGITKDKKKVEAIVNKLSPKSKDEVRTFMGMINYLHRYIKGLAEIAAPLTDLLKKSVLFVWKHNHEEAYQKLQKAIATDVMLQVPKGMGDYILEVDASDCGVGVVLKQVQGEREVLLEFGSSKLSETQQRWSTREREAWAIRWGVQHVADIIRGAHAIVRTDHHSLLWMRDAVDAKVFRWSLYLQQFHLTIEHIDGRKNSVADYLSRAVVDEMIPPDTWEYLLPPDPREWERTQKAYVGEGDIAVQEPRDIVVHIPAMPSLEDLKTPEEDIEERERKWLVKAPDGLWYHTKSRRLWIPPAHREALLYKYHTGRFGGHSGMKRTINKLKLVVWWLRMDVDVENYIAQCVGCSRNFPPNTQYVRRALDAPVPFQTISIDFVGPRKVGVCTWYYGVVVDHSSRFMVSRAYTHKPDAKDIQDFLRIYWMPLFGAPTVMVCDRERVFTPELCRWIAGYMGTRVAQTSAGYPQGNGINESSHRAIEKSLKIQIQSNTTAPFDLLLAEATLAYNCAPHSTIGDSPFRRLFGMEPILPGMQALHNQGEEQRQTLQLEGRFQQALRSAVEVQASLLLHPIRNLKKGDIVVYLLTDWQVRVAKRTSGHHQYTSGWSLPHRVVEVQDNKVMVRAIGCVGGEPRQVPLRLCRILKGAIHAGEGIPEGTREGEEPQRPRQRQRRSQPNEEEEEEGL